MEEYINNLLREKVSKVWGVKVKTFSVDELRRIVDQVNTVKAIIDKRKGDEKNN